MKPKVVKLLTLFLSGIILTELFVWGILSLSGKKGIVIDVDGTDSGIVSAEEFGEDIKSEIYRTDPVDLARHFGSERKQTYSAPVKTNAASPVRNTEKRVAYKKVKWLVYVGSSVDSAGREISYFKDSRTGRVYELGPDAVDGGWKYLSEDSSAVLLEKDGEIYEVEK